MFPKRHKFALLAAFAAVAAAIYLAAFYIPTERKLSEISGKKAAAAEDLALAEEAVREYAEMKSELYEAASAPGLGEMPEYDNIDALTGYLGSVFSGSTPELYYETPVAEGSVVMRTVSFGFSAESYSEMKSTLSLLTGSGFRCQLKSVSLSSESGDISNGGLRVSGSIVFYEYLSPENAG